MDLRTTDQLAESQPLNGADTKLTIRIVEMKDIKPSRRVVAPQKAENLQKEFKGRVDTVSEFIDGIRTEPVTFRTVLTTMKSSSQRLQNMTVQKDMTELKEESPDSNEIFSLIGIREPLPLKEERAQVSAFFAGKNPEATQEEKIRAKEAEEFLLKAHMPLIEAFAKKFAPDEASIDDYMQEGVIDFIETLRTTFKEGQSRIVSYMTYSLYRTLLRLAATSGAMIPHLTNALFLSKYEKFCEEYTQKNGEVDDSKLMGKFSEEYEIGGVREKLNKLALRDVTLVPGTRFNEVIDENADLQNTVELKEEAQIVAKLLNDLSPEIQNATRIQYDINGAVPDKGLSIWKRNALSNQALHYIRKVIKARREAAYQIRKESELKSTEEANSLTCGAQLDAEVN